MNKGVIATIVATVILLIGGVFIFSKNSPSTSPTLSSLPANTYEYFWGDGCPHCANVDAFVETWKKDKPDIYSKVTINKKEVWNNKSNANYMLERAKSCGLDTKTLGVPFLYTFDGKCVGGDVDIINLYKSIN